MDEGGEERDKETSEKHSEDHPLSCYILASRRVVFFIHSRRSPRSKKKEEVMKSVNTVYWVEKMNAKKIDLLQKKNRGLSDMFQPREKVLRVKEGK